MSTQSTEGKIMQIRVHEKTYKALLIERAKVEAEKGRPASFDDAIQHMMEVKK
jgi:hypothetical protein